MQDYKADMRKEGVCVMKVPLMRRHIKSGATPEFLNAQKVPCGLFDKVSKAFHQFVGAGIMFPATHSEGTTPIVQVVKQYGTFLICADF